MSEWQDISTAPKDGTTVLLFTPGRGQQVAAGAWRAIESWASYERVMGEPKWHGPGVGGSPTHWMPLPFPPAIRQHSQKGERL